MNKNLIIFCLTSSSEEFREEGRLLNELELSRTLDNLGYDTLFERIVEHRYKVGWILEKTFKRVLSHQSEHEDRYEQILVCCDFEIAYQNLDDALESQIKSEITFKAFDRLREEIETFKHTRRK